MTSSHLMTSYLPMPVTFTKGEGVWLEDDQGDRYLDALGGIAVCALGHAHPEIADAISQQAKTLIHTSNLYQIDLQKKLADKLTTIAGMDAAFFGNSGAEANEAAIKLARLHGKQQGIKEPAIIVMEGSFHGRTLATLSATGNRKVQSGFEPLVQGFVRVPYNDIDSIKAVAANRQDIAAIFVEPVQGEGGVNTPASSYLSELRTVCDDNDWLLMLDEIQTGIGRTGKWFAYQHSDIFPDVITSAKALGNGVPIGACLARGAAAALFQPGHHGSTFGGNPLACRTALTVIDIIEKENLLETSAQLSAEMLNRFRSNFSDIEQVIEIRGQGMMIGIELDRPCTELVNMALEEKLLINVTANSTVRLLPPLIMNKQECDQVVDKVSGLINKFLNED